MQHKLSKRGVFTVLDSHQDGYGDRFNGLGLPDYVTFDDGLPFDSSLRFPLNYFQPGTSRAFDNLYAEQGRVLALLRPRLADDDPLRFATRSAARGLRPHERALARHRLHGCVAPAGCPERDPAVIQPFLEALARAIRQVDRERPVFYEPTIFFNQGAVNGYVKPPRALAPAALSFHNQCPTRAALPGDPRPRPGRAGAHRSARRSRPSVMRHAEELAARLGGPPLMTEVAATTDQDYDGLNCLLERSERFMTGFTYGLSWRSGELRNLAPAKTRGDLPRVPAGGGRHPADLRLRRAHRAVPAGLRDPARRAGATTVITVPSAVHYPAGYRVRAAGARVTSKDANGVRVRNRPHARYVAVAVEPPAGDTTPRPVADLLRLARGCGGARALGLRRPGPGPPARRRPG